MKKVPMRSCVVTHEKLPKNELIRVVRGTNGEVFWDKTLKANGRGAYIKSSLDVINKCEKNKILDRHLEVNVPSNVYEEIREYILNNK
jgi:hypothetical protein